MPADTRVLVIAGPTATGKTSLGIRIARELNGEIISGDSIQIYRGLDIGSAKASVQEQSQAVHHLIDIKDPKENYSVKEFQDLARDKIEDITSRGKLPIIVGGTVNGNIRTSADSYVTQQGKCKGEIFTKNLFVEGNVEAKSVVEDTAQIKNTGVYNGYMETTKLDTEYGSVFNGSLNLKMKTTPAPVAETAVEPTTSEGKREVFDIEMSFK